MSIAVVVFSVLSGSFAFAQDYVPGEVLVRLKGKMSGAVVSNFMGKMQGKMELKGSFSAMNIHRFELKVGASVENAVAELRADPDVQYAEPNFILRKNQESLESSQALSESDVSALVQAGDDYSQSYANTQINQAWGTVAVPFMKTLAQNSDRPIVAVVDTGVDYNHAVFQHSGAMWVNPGEIPGNGIDDDGNGYIDDVYGYDFHNRDGNPMDDDEHGTHCAGIILGVGQDIFANSLEPAKVRIMALKFLGADGSGSTSDAIAAIYYAVNNGAQVISNSWGGANYSQSLHDALTFAYQHQVFIASAAGNGSNGVGYSTDSSPLFPASYPVPGQVAVAASTDWDNLASFSNFGINSVHVAAPGVSILSTIPNNSYRYMSGTSMATPFISGLAAMILREAPNLSGYQIRDLMINSSDYVSALSSKTQSHGRINVFGAIAGAKAQINTASFLPSYVADARGMASVDGGSSSSGPAGCGTVSTALLGELGKTGAGGGSGSSGIMLILAFTLLPLIVWQVVRSRSTQSRRRFDRFVMNSDIQLKVGGRELVGHMKTISEGGLSFSAEEMLDKGGIVNIQIQSPDGHEMVQIQGHIVWNEKNKAYGVQFDEAREGVLSCIRQWTMNLVKAS